MQSTVERRKIRPWPEFFYSCTLVLAQDTWESAGSFSEFAQDHIYFGYCIMVFAVTLILSLIRAGKAERAGFHIARVVGFYAIVMAIALLWMGNLPRLIIFALGLAMLLTPMWSKTNITQAQP